MDKLLCNVRHYYEVPFWTNIIELNSEQVPPLNNSTI